MVRTLRSAKYGKLLSLAMPKRIETDAEMDHFIEMMVPLSRAIEHGTAGPEEIALHSLLATLIKEYDDRAYPLSGKVVDERGEPAGRGDGTGLVNRCAK